MDARLERARQLKQSLIEFVIEAEGDLAESLESYVATNSRKEAKSNRYDPTYEQNLLIDSFLTEGEVSGKTPIDVFIKEQLELPDSDRTLLKSWHRSFIGLFAVIKILPDGFELMNWLSAKHYFVKPNDAKTLKEMERFKEGEILLVRIAPVTDDYWMFSGPCIPMGRLGKPKLAVAIGNFKDDHKGALYSDAPELLEEAWESVAKYHREFLNFFGSDEVTLPGRELNEKIAELQEIITKEQLAAAGVDESKSLSELADEAGLAEEEMKAAAVEAGADSDEISQLFESSQGVTKMVMPKAELPPELKRAEQVTVLTHPRWGQMFLPDYSQFQTILASEDWQTNNTAEKLVRKYLQEPRINAFIWQRLAEGHPTQLEKLLQTVLACPDFKLKHDLESLLQEHNKPLEPDLPEIASVPLHLHNLFQEALIEVNKSKSKNKGKKKKKAVGGFK